MTMKSKIVFMGTPQFAVNSLQALIDNKANIVGVFTNPDKPKGRGYKLQPPPVKELAQQNSLQVYQPASVKSEETLNILQTLAPDLIVVVAYGKILPKEVLNLPKLGCINVHGSLLPKYRGAAPIQWAVLNGEEKTGVTIMYLGEGMDTGDMILKEEIPIGENETSGEVFDKLAVLGADALIKAIGQIEEGTANRTPQNHNEATMAPMLKKEMAEIDFTKSAEEIHNSIRGLNPWPIAYTHFGKKRLKVFAGAATNDKTKSAPGQIIAKDKFLVACGQGTAIEFTDVLLEGGKRVAGDQFIKTRVIEDGFKLGE